MADLSQFRAGGPTAAPVSAQQPVVDTSDAVALNTATKIAGLGAALYQGNKKREAATNVENAKRDLTQRLITIADNASMGEIDQRTAKAATRKLYNEELATGKLPSEDLRTIFSDFIDIGQAVKEGTPEEQERARVRKSAVDAGWVKPGMSEAQSQTQINAYQDFLMAGDKLSRAKSQREFDRTARVEEQRLALGQMNAAYTQKFKSDVDKVINDLRSGLLSEEEAVAQLNGQWATIQSVINSQGTEAGNEYLNNLINPMKIMYETALGAADGSTSREIYENKSAKALSMARANILADPQTAEVAAFSSMFQNADILLQKEINQEVLKFMGRNSDTTKRPVDVTDPDTKADTAVYFKTVKDSIKTLNNGAAEDKDKMTAEVGANLSQIIKGVGRYGSSVENPEELNTAVNFLADPSVGRFLAAQGGVPADVSQEAKIVFEEAYRQPALQSVLDAFNGGRIQGISSRALGFDAISDTDVASSIIPVFDQTGVTFIMDASVKGVDRVAVRAKIKDLNKNAAPVLNKVIRLDAHLNGSIDYSKTYRDNYEELLSPAPEQAPEESPEVSSVTREDIVDPEAAPYMRELPSQMVATIETLKTQGVPREKAEELLQYLDISPDRGTGGDIYAAIAQVYGG